MLRSEELAILLQETVEKLKQQWEVNNELKALIEQNTRQMAEIAAKQTPQQASGRRSCSTSTGRVAQDQGIQAILYIYMMLLSIH